MKGHGWEPECFSAELQGGEEQLRNSIISFCSLARRLGAQTVAVLSSAPPPSFSSSPPLLHASSLSSRLLALSLSPQSARVVCRLKLTYAAGIVKVTVTPALFAHGTKFNLCR